MSVGSERIAIFTGHFGSGKTELAINYSIAAATEGKKTVVVDLDIVNPFFRSSEKRDVLEEQGIKVISPNFAGTGIDIPSLSAQIYSVFQTRDHKIIFDVGGDDIGATALGSFYPYFKQDDYRVYYVINIRRPLSNNEQDIMDMLESIETNSRLGVTHLINNSNISYETTIRDLIDGQAVVEGISKVTGKPIAYISGTEEVLMSLPPDLKTKAFPLEIFMTPIWEQ
ncbi:MAG TPA: ATP-binding protein [Clostridia bacterium]|nr:ATP-binding protein [Clostridia bacterium]